MKGLTTTEFIQALLIFAVLIAIDGLSGFVSGIDTAKPLAAVALWVACVAFVKSGMFKHGEES